MCRRLKNASIDLFANLLRPNSDKLLAFKCRREFSNTHDLRVYLWSRFYTSFRFLIRKKKFVQGTFNFQKKNYDSQFLLDRIFVNGQISL